MDPQDLINMSEWMLYPRLQMSKWTNRFAKMVGFEFYYFSDQMDFLEEAWESW